MKKKFTKKHEREALRRFMESLNLVGKVCKFPQVFNK